MQGTRSNERELDDVRKAAVTSAADFLEGIAKLKRLGERLAPRPIETQRNREGDLLFDLLRLNADYMTQLSQLSRAHRDFATASLERLYAGLTSHLPEAGGEELTFGSGAEPWTRSFVLENTFDPNATLTSIEWSAFRASRPSQPVDVVPTIAAIGWDLKERQLKTVYRVPVRVSLRLDPEPFAEGRIYRAELTMRLGGRTRRVTLTVDRRRQPR